jgi:hypothetical protein|tara:strand:+ start:1204 stop:2106 length:903 start_codon:yes stop_codon:yes gene_type:complete
MFKDSIVKDKRTMYDGLGETVYNRTDSRCICDTNPSLISAYDDLPTIPIFKDFKNELGYQGEVVLLEKVKSLRQFTFPSDIDVLSSLNDKSIIPLISKYEWSNKSDGVEMIRLVKELRKKSVYYSKVTDEEDDMYSTNVCNILTKLKNHYKRMKKSKKSQDNIYSALKIQLNKLKYQELKRQKTKSNQVVAFFREFTDLQIIYNVIKSVSVDRAAPMYYLEFWKVMFVPQQHYTVMSYNANKLNSGINDTTVSKLISNYNNKNKKLISYNTPFITNRYIRKLLDVTDVYEDNDDDDFDDE